MKLKTYVLLFVNKLTLAYGIKEISAKSDLWMQSYDHLKLEEIDKAKNQHNFTIDIVGRISITFRWTFLYFNNSDYNSFCFAL